MTPNEPLGLPRGSVRAILTLLLLVLVAVSMFVPVADGASEVRAALLALAGIAVRDYFGSRQVQNVADGPPTNPPAINE